MKQKTTCICMFATVLLLNISCEKKVNKTEYPRIEKASWLLGKWENNSAEGKLSENWKKVNDSTFIGESHFVVDNDTVFAETIQLEDRIGSLFYTVTVPGQNDEKPVSFELTVALETQLIFENPAHDFPKRIAYDKIGADSLVARIYGVKDGKVESETFRMRKMQ